MHNKASSIISPSSYTAVIKPKAPEEKFSKTQPLSVKIQMQFLCQKNITPTFLC